MLVLALCKLYFKPVIFLELYYDAKKQCYKDLNFGTLSMLGAVGSAFDKKTRELANKAKEKNLGGNFKGDFNQMGGLLIIKKGKLELYGVIELPSTSLLSNLAC